VHGVIFVVCPFESKHASLLFVVGVMLLGFPVQTC